MSELKTKQNEETPVPEEKLALRQQVRDLRDHLQIMRRRIIGGFVAESLLKQIDAALASSAAPVTEKEGGK